METTSGEGSNEVRRILALILARISQQNGGIGGKARVQKATPATTFPKYTDKQMTSYITFGEIFVRMQAIYTIKTVKSQWKAENGDKSICRCFMRAFYLTSCNQTLEAVKFVMAYKIPYSLLPQARKTTSPAQEWLL